jgi:hypothetical protein
MLAACRLASQPSTWLVLARSHDLWGLRTLGVFAWDRIPSMSLLPAAHGLADHNKKGRLAPAHAGSRWLGALHQGPLAMGILGGSHSPHPLSVVAWGRIPSMSLLLAAHGLADHKRGSLLRTRAGLRLFGALHQGPLAMGILGGLHSPHAACGLACHMGVQP